MKIKAMHKQIFTWVFAAILVVGISGVGAQSLQDHQQQEMVDEISALYIDEYVDTSFENLSKAYWAIGKFDMSNDVAVDNFLLINECETYLRFFQRDFEWKQVRDDARKSILRDMAGFPRKFQAVLPVRLGRYDFDNHYFELADDSKITNMTRIDLMTNSFVNHVCGADGEIQGYPRNILLVLTYPFALERVKVTPDIARLYIDETQRIMDGLPLHERHRYQRIAYLRLKVTLNRFVSETRLDVSYLRAVVHATLDDWELYADAALQKPLYINDLQRANFDKNQAHQKMIQRKIDSLDRSEDPLEYQLPDLQ